MMSRKAKPTKYASARVTPAILEEIQHLADKEFRTMSSMIRVLIEEALEQRRSREQTRATA